MSEKAPRRLQVSRRGLGGAGCRPRHREGQLVLRLPQRPLLSPVAQCLEQQLAVQTEALLVELERGERLWQLQRQPLHALGVPARLAEAEQGLRSAEVPPRGMPPRVRQIGAAEMLPPRCRPERLPPRGCQILPTTCSRDSRRGAELTPPTWKTSPPRDLGRYGEIWDAHLED